MAVHYGFDTANYIYNVASAAKAKWGTGIFYARYITPSPGANRITQSSAAQEFRTGWDYGVRHFMPISEPQQSRLNGTFADGQADASSSCSALVNVYHAIGSSVITDANRLYVYLCMESGTNLSTAYWNGWAQYIDGYNFAGLGLILYPGLYCNPGGSGRSCAALSQTACWGLWPSEHEYCSDCTPFSSGHTWAGESCSGVPSIVWQMAEQGSCQGSPCYRGTFPNVDADRTNGNYTAVKYMVKIAFKP